jgi:mycoredoxin
MTTRDAADQPPILMYTGTWCGDCRPAKRIFASFHLPFIEVNVEEDEQAAAFVLRLNRGMVSVPTILFPDGSWLVEPSARALEAKLRAFGGSSSRWKKMKAEAPQ